MAKLHISTRDRYAVAMTTKHRDMKEMMLSEMVECNNERHCKGFCFLSLLFLIDMCNIMSYIVC